MSFSPDYALMTDAEKIAYLWVHLERLERTVAALVAEIDLRDEADRKTAHA